MKVNVLGTDYTIVLVSDAESEIRVDNYESHRGDPHNKANLNKQIKKNIRHELIHAFLFESGLAESSPWALNEELVDWIAIQGPKLWKAWQEAEAV